MKDYSIQFNLEEDEPMVVDPVYISSDESDSTSRSSPKHYFTAHFSDEYNVINHFMIIQREETVDGTQPPPAVHLITNLSPTHLRPTKLLLIGQVGQNDPQQDCCIAVLSSPTQSNFAAGSHPFLTHQNRHPLGFKPVIN